MQTKLHQTEVSGKIGQTLLHRADDDNLKDTQNTNRRRRFNDDDLHHQLQRHTPLSAQNSQLVLLGCLFQRPYSLFTLKQLSQRQIRVY